MLLILGYEKAFYTSELKCYVFHDVFKSKVLIANYAFCSIILRAQELYTVFYLFFGENFILRVLQDSFCLSK